jgi:hypothetical protein
MSVNLIVGNWRRLVAYTDEETGDITFVEAREI